MPLFRPTTSHQPTCPAVADAGAPKAVLAYTVYGMSYIPYIYGFKKKTVYTEYTVSLCGGGNGYGDRYMKRLFSAPFYFEWKKITSTVHFNFLLQLLQIKKLTIWGKLCRHWGPRSLMGSFGKQLANGYCGQEASERLNNELRNRQQHETSQANLRLLTKKMRNFQDESPKHYDRTWKQWSSK